MKMERFSTSGIKNMANRMGYSLSPSFQDESTLGISMMSNRLNQAGGHAQQNRMIRDKRRTLDKAVLYSYQGAFVKKYRI